MTWVSLRNPATQFAPMTIRGAQGVNLLASTNDSAAQAKYRLNDKLYDRSG